MSMAIADPLQGALARVDRRFITASLIPVTLLVAAYIAVVVISGKDSAATIDAWRHLSASEQLLAWAAFALTSWFLAGLLSSNWRKIVRLYEGYPLRRLAIRAGSGQLPKNWFDLPGVHWHRRRLDEVSAHDAYYRYPPEEHVSDLLPTTIGNILISSERYALDRYGLDVNLLWPRLYWQLPLEVRQSLDAFKEEHQIPLALSFVSGVFGFVAGATVLVRGGSPRLFLTVTAAAFALAIMAYLLAIERTEEYAEQLRTTVDLHRKLLREQWSGGPRRYADDREFFRASVLFIRDGEELLDEPADTSISPPPRLDAPDFDEPHAYERLWRGAFWLARIVRRPRLLHTASATIALLVAVGYWWSASHQLNRETPIVRELTLPLVPQLPDAAMPTNGQLVHVVLQPCGRLIPSVRVVAVLQVGLTPSTTTTSSAGATPVPAPGSTSTTRYLTLAFSESDERKADGCAPTGVAIYRPA